jgi:hypothetical protein
VHAIIQVFRGDADRSRVQLSTIAADAWRRSAYWLQASGCAFYFLDRIAELGIADAVPHEVLRRLATDLRKNRVRTEAMFREFQLLNGAFQRAGIVYANYKGFTLCSHSCRSLELRHQMDFDFIVAREHLPRARQCLEARGYTLTAATPKTWEFKAGNYVRSKWDSYSMGRYRAVELHFGIAPDHTGTDTRLQRTSSWCWAGAEFPALTPEDQLIAQALHLFKHLRSESTRPAWVLEFREHVLSRRDDTTFWTHVRGLASATGPHAQPAIGISILIASQLFGRFAPPGFQEWALAAVPPTIRLWAQQYGADAVLADFPGTKLFLLLETELEQLGNRRGSTVRKRLLPIRPAPAIFTPRPHETATERLHRRVMQIRFTLFRARFHLVEGARYLIELPRWRRRIAELGLNGTAVVKQGREMTTHKQLNDNLRPGSL